MLWVYLIEDMRVALSSYRVTFIKCILLTYQCWETSEQKMVALTLIDCHSIHEAATRLLAKKIAFTFFRIVTQCCGFNFRRRSSSEAFWSDAFVWCSNRWIPLCCLQDPTARWQLATTNRRASKYQHHAVPANVVWHKERCITVCEVGIDLSSYTQSVNFC